MTYFQYSVDAQEISKKCTIGLFFEGAMRLRQDRINGQTIEWGIPESQRPTFGWPRLVITTPFDVVELMIEETNLGMSVIAKLNGFKPSSSIDGFYSKYEKLSDLVAKVLGFEGFNFDYAVGITEVQKIAA